MIRKKFTKKKMLVSVTMIILLSMLSYGIIPHTNKQFDFLVYLTFYINGAFSILIISTCDYRKTFSLESFFWIFSFFFFFLSPLIQYETNEFPWDLKPTNTEIILANLLILLWLLFCWMGINIKIKRNTNYNKKKFTCNIVRINKINYHFVFNIIAILITINTVRSVGMINLLSRGTNMTSANVDSSLTMLIGNCQGAFLVFNSAINLIDFRDKKRNRFSLIISILTLLLCCFPTGQSRFNAATIYLGLLLVTFGDKFKRKQFILLFLFSFLIIFPLMNGFRNIEFTDFSLQSSIESLFKDFSNNFTEGHYDAYSMFIRTIRYVSVNGVVFGKQMIGNLLFFIPREIWIDKPLGTGYTIMNSINYGFTNVSEPLIGEVYFNFGYIGIIICGYILGTFMRHIDNIYWNSSVDKKSFIRLIYPFYIFLFFFSLRGDFLSTFAFTSAYVSVFFVLYHLTKRE